MILANNFGRNMALPVRYSAKRCVKSQVGKRLQIVTNNHKKNRVTLGGVSQCS